MQQTRPRSLPPLHGIRVIDLTRILSGPFCTMMLGDLGADVIKVEDPGTGDPIRHTGAGADGLSWYFASFNRNKRSVTLDLRSEHGRRQLSQLLASADVLVENFRPGVLDKMGFTEQALEKINPRLVVASINGYGSTGPYAERPAFDFVIQAMSGFMSTNGEPDGPSLRSGIPVTDLIAGLYATLGVVSALRGRELNGAGQRVEASMLSGIMSMFAYLASDFLATGVSPARVGNEHPITAPYGLFRTADGEIAVAPSTEAILRKFLKAIDAEELLARDAYSTNAKRVACRAEMNDLINERMSSRTCDEWIGTLNQAGVPCGRVQTLSEALHDPQVLHQGMVMDVPHPGHGSVRMLGFPVKYSATPCQVRRPAPDLGQHNDEVLGALAPSSLPA